VLIGVAPQAAHAAYIQYALNQPLLESTPWYSATGTVKGGRAYLSVSTVPRTFIQTTSGNYLIASAYVDGGAVANLSHVVYNNARSRCYWDFLGGTIPGNPTINANCWRIN